ncbi:MAG: hypothetical protein FWE41_03245 [Coriobacteriia bacterium]|nr:hypothetical protein [Coriobacteriia bacterium]MCL2750061.1 hypothetical protein [Coriobacteriia bacterium]
MDIGIVIAVIAGLAGGLIGCIPFVVVHRRMKKGVKKDALGAIIPGLLATMISFLIMTVEIVICFFINSDYLLPFAISAIAVFLLAMIVFTATLMRK